MERVLITGGAGFIGSHTCLSLLEKKYEVIVLDSFINSTFKSIENIRNIFFSNFGDSGNSLLLKKGDIRDKNVLGNLFGESIKKGKPIKAVLHFAGLKSVSDSISSPISYWESNLIGTINLLNVMRKYDCRKLVFSSSATIYKPKLNNLINEFSDLSPINPYGNTKLTIETFLNDVYQSEPDLWSIALLRYFNPVGAHSSGLLGEEPLGTPNNLFPIILKVCSGELKLLQVYGNDWPTHDGTCIRDFIHVMDLAEAHSAALDFLNSSDPQIAKFNIGTGRGTSVLEIIETFKRVNKCNLPYEFSKRREGDSPFVVADNSLALKELNWRPKRNITQMCQDSWRYKKLN